jgi:mannobiose 2-epimerase
MMKTTLSATQFEDELYRNILPFWMKNAPDEENGGFYGGITNSLEVRNEVPRTAISCTRFLWTFSHAYRTVPEEKFLVIAHKAFNYLKAVFWDRDFGGLYWSVNQHGQVVGDRKHHYAQAFGIYGLSEYFKATGNEESRRLAHSLFDLLETQAFDPSYGGYIEGRARDWSPLPDMRLGADDLNCQKSMNTTLHIMEAYTNLIAVARDGSVAERLREIILQFQNHIIGPANHFRLYFDSDWSPLSDHISYGHDIEGSWLLMEAAEALGDAALSSAATASALALAEAVFKEGLRPDHAVIHEDSPTGLINPNLEWWPQAEAVVGFYNAYQLTGDQKFEAAASHSWAFIQDHLVDPVHGGWFKRLYPDGSVNRQSLKAGPWEGPYHEARMCFEMIKRLTNQTEPV